MSNLVVSQNLFSLSPVILNKSDRRRREGAVKNPEVIPAPIQHQGVSTRMHGENSLKRHGLNKNPRGPFGSAQGRLFTPRYRFRPSEKEFSRSVQDDRGGGVLFCPKRHF